MEIIEIDAVMVDEHDHEVATRQSMVHPTRRPQFIALCRELPHIHQSNVDGAQLQPHFDAWLQHHLRDMQSWPSRDGDHQQLDIE